jgi:NTE family protein
MMADPSSGNKQSNDKPFVVMALQGGGAMGAFQVGAYQALSEKGYEPDWVAGISIGAINASIIAGNPQKDRLKRLNEFWSTVAGHLDWWDFVPNYSEKFANLWKIWLSLVGGVPGFFRPHYIPPPFVPLGSPQACSLYSVHQLRKTLESLIDFRILNDYDSPTHVWLSLGATNVTEGAPKTFESFGGKAVQITVDHVMASGAVVPSFPGVVVDGGLCWDGGVTSNTCVRHLLDHLNKIAEDKHVLVFAINLWSHDDREPKSFEEVCWRLKQIYFSSRLRSEMDHGKTFLDCERLNEQATSGGTAAKGKRHIDFVCISYPSDPNEIPLGDLLFSRTAIERRIRKGHSTMLEQLEKDPRPWDLHGKDEWVSTHYC